MPANRISPPGQKIAAVVADADGRENGGAANRLVFFRWGLIPSWAKDPSIGRKMFNARSESVAEKPSFRDAFRNRRCLIPADGFYEWKKSGERKAPYLFRLESKEPLALAGLYEKWSSPSGSPVYSCTILTTRADETVAPIHDRMPVIVPKAYHSLWLDPSVKQKADLNPILRPRTVALEVLPAGGILQGHPEPEEH